MVDVTESKQTTKGANGQIPDLTGDIRHLVPPLGLRNYWYPALLKKRIPKRHPVRVNMMGERIAFYRGSQGQPVAVLDICPHRGARLSEGTCHWKGTVSCPYHGWTFDEHGKNVAVLSEGPDSKICGKPGTEAKVYATRELKGLVFVWIGDTEPAPIEEDVPEEFFDQKATVLVSEGTDWETNWCQALENSMDSHVNYLHRDNMQSVLNSTTYMARVAGMGGQRPVFTGNGLRGGAPMPTRWATQDRYSSGWIWPKHRFRRWWAWLFVPLFSITRISAPVNKNVEWWSPGHHLPGMFRTGGAPPLKRGRFRLGGGGLFGNLTRQVVAIEKGLTHVWYYHYTYTRPRNIVEKLWQRLLYVTMYRWLADTNFSQQDGSAMGGQLWDETEQLSPTDAEVVQWRRLVVTKHYGGRDASFGGVKTGEAAEEAPPIHSSTI